MKSFIKLPAYGILTTVKKSLYRLTGVYMAGTVKIGFALFVAL